MLEGDEDMHCSFFEEPFGFEHSFKISAVFCGKNVILVAQERLSLLTRMHIHRLTDNGKLFSMPKIIKFEVPKFEKYPCFSNCSKYN